MPANRRRATLTATLLTLVLGLLVLTVIATSAVDRYATDQVVADLQERFFRSFSLALATRMSTALTSADRTFDEVRSLARQGRLQVGDRDALGDYLVERLRYLPDVDRLYYGDQS